MKDTLFNKLNSSLASLKEAVENASKVLEKIELAEVWNSKYVSALPNMAFAVVEKGYKEGGNKASRHLPHHNKSVKSATENSSVDLPHYRNALARAGQIKSVLGKESDSSLRKKAATHLEKHRAVLKKSSASFSAEEKKIWVECEELFISNIKATKVSIY